jgi:Alpha amylase, catalytic domain
MFKIQNQSLLMFKRLLISVFLFNLLISPVFCQNLDISMQAWYWDYFQNGNFGNWINNLNNKGTELQNAGFKHIWVPPLSRSSTWNNQSNGYNPKDLYDLGEFGGACAWGTRTQLNSLISSYNTKGLNVISDVIYNHRDGGLPEKNQAVKYFITNTSNSVVYPSDRFFCALPLGSGNPGNNGAGDYYFKVRSKSFGYNSNQYKFYARTASTAYQGDYWESEPNGGGDCSQSNFESYTLGKNLFATLGPDGNGCHVDEIKITLTAGNFNTVDDTLFIYLNNISGGYSDHYIYGIWSVPRGQNIVNELEYHTWTNFNNMPSGQGTINYNGFRPNDNTANSSGVTENFSWPLNFPLFFYDYDQDQSATENMLRAYTKWQIQNVGLKGLRMDAVKHFDAGFVGDLMNHLVDNSATPQFVVGEFFDYNAGILQGWVNDVKNAMNANTRNQVKVRAFDFALRGALKNACDQFGYDVRNVFNSGMVEEANSSPFDVVTFVDNHDLRHEGSYINNDAKLAYAYILSNNQIGAPCVFYPDYFGGSVGGAPNIMLKEEINDLIELHEQYIFGSPNVDYLSRFSTPYYQYFVPNGNNGSSATTLVYQMQANSSGKTVIVAINFSGTPLDMYQGVNTGWGATAGTTFTDMLGFSGTTYTNITNNNELHITLPPRSYTVYVQGQLTPLPVELLKFQALPDQEKVLLRWASQNEQDLKKYSIERSVGNELNFKQIGEMPGKGTAFRGSEYTYYDEKPAFNQAMYYRLRMTDQDGSETYSPVRQLMLTKRLFEAYLAPNPGANTTLFLNRVTAGDVRLNIVDALGRIVLEENLSLEAGETYLPLNGQHWPSGLYRVSIQDAAEQMTLSWEKH